MDSNNNLPGVGLASVLRQAQYIYRHPGRRDRDADLGFNLYNRYAFEIIVALRIVFMYLGLPRRHDTASATPPVLAGEPAHRDVGLVSLRRMAVTTNVIAVFYGATKWP